MELTVNLFSKGLQIDTHPMVLDNNTLSDALNATFVTMNGNEVVLQNDMGNRRIDNAFLPSGYLPLGMKEYGGVIYVAAYNPLTNRGLIGSFPSPQRKVNIDNKGLFLDLSDFIKELENIDFIYEEDNSSATNTDVYNENLKNNDNDNCEGINELILGENEGNDVIPPINLEEYHEENNYYPDPVIPTEEEEEHNQGEDLPINPILYFTPTSLTITSENYTLPTLVNTNNVTVLWSSSNPEIGVNTFTGEIISILINGTTTITASFGGNSLYNEASASYTLTINIEHGGGNGGGNEEENESTYAPSEEIDMGTYVDGVKYLWSPYNLGVHDGNEESSGKYFAWGELTDKSSYTFENYTMEAKDANTYLNLFTNNLLPSNMDAATALWGNDWEIPSNELIGALILNSTLNICNIRNVVCLQFISKVTNNSLLLPMTGYIDGTTDLREILEYLIGKYLTKDGSGGQNNIALTVEDPEGNQESPNPAYSQPISSYMGLMIRPVKKVSSSEENPVTHLDFVDLGLSVMWSTKNLGAIDETDIGNKYAWGETTTKSTFTQANYSNLSDSVILDNGLLKSEYDAASVAYSNSKLRMPTRLEISELILGCNKSWEVKSIGTNSLVEGIKFTSKSNGNSIFIPAEDPNEVTFCWSSTATENNSSNAEGLRFKFENEIGVLEALNTQPRFQGFFIRPVLSETSGNSSTIPTRSLSKSLLRNSNNENTQYYGHYIEKDYIVIPISDKTVLHTGDKFSVYSQLIEEMLPYLTLPSLEKNNLFTFQVGIFNSLNEFIDISNKMKLWDFGEELYYINKESGIEEGGTINDNELLKIRNRLAINTYSLKMSSPLYLKAILNHIDNVEYQVYGERINDSQVELEFQVEYHYNCIDNISGKLFRIHFINKNKTNNSSFYEELISEEEKNSIEISPIYDGGTDLYSLTLTYKTIINATPKQLSGEKKYEYEIWFPLLLNIDIWENDNIYIKSLNKKGELDLSKIGSDTIVFKGYRYYNNTTTKITNLEINLESYPKKGSDMALKVTVRSSSTLGLISQTIENPGTGNLLITFSYSELDERTTYYLWFEKIHSENKGLKEVLDEHRPHLYITTGIFNGNYIGLKSLPLDTRESNDENYYTNYGLRWLRYYHDRLKDCYIKDFSIIEKLYLLPVLTYSIDNTISDSAITTNGKYIFPVAYTPENNIETYKVTEQWDINNTLNLSITVNDIELYPSEVDNALGVATGDKKLRIKRVSSRSINDNEINKSNKYYYYSKDLFGVHNTDLGLNGDHIIKIEEFRTTLTSSLNLQKVKLTSRVTVNNIVKGFLVNKTIFCEHVITSFWNFIRSRYYGNTVSKVLIKNPYFCVDYEGDTFASIVYTDKLTKVQDLTYTAGENAYLPLNGRKADASYIEDVVRDHICDIINDKSNGNLFAIEVSTNDFIQGYLPCCLQDYTFNLLYQEGVYVAFPEDLNPNISLADIKPGGPGISYVHRAFRRIWMKINKFEYIPIYVTWPRDSLGNYLEDDPEIINHVYDDAGFHNLLLHIPHYYEYETGGKTLPEKVFNTSNYSRTNEFEVDSNVTIEVIGMAKEIEDAGCCTLKCRDSLISEYITFKEGTIHSNLNFEEDIENINNYKVSCGVMDGIYDSHNLYIRDCKGNPLDPLYIYYNDYEGKGLNGKSFKPSYIAEKFYVPELDLYLPELKVSRKLYGGINGEHTLINEFVYPNKTIRDLLKSKLTGWDTHYYDGGDENITIKQWEDENYVFHSERHLPLKTKNIFDRTYIIGYGLTSKEMWVWQDFDDYINLLNS